MATSPSPVLRVSGLSKHYQARQSWLASLLASDSQNDEPIKAVDNVSFEVAAGEVFGLLGESGCGKTTLARTLLRLTEPTSGSAWLNGQSIFDMSPDGVRTQLRANTRMIFQHPDAVVNPAHTVSMILDQALRLHTNLDAEERRARSRTLLELVDLPANYLNKYPRALSGGQKRRVGICRALATEPDVIIADEPFSGLDVSLQEQIVHIFQSIQQEKALTVILISHDVGLVLRMCDRVGIMHEGALVDVLDEGAVAPDACSHPYAASLLRAHFATRRVA